MSIADYYYEGLGFIKYFYEHIFQKGDGETIFIEHDFKIKLYDGSNFIGIIDRISKHNEGLLRVTDYKTGKRIPNPGDDIQLLSYALYIFREHDVSEVEVCFESLRKRSSPKALIAKDKIQLFEKKLGDYISKIEGNRYFDPNPGVLCSWCEYQHLCDL